MEGVIIKTENALKQQTKDLVFSEGFSGEPKLPQVYHSLFPNDPDWEDHYYHKIDTSSELVNTLRNDLSFFVRRQNGPDRLIGLEAQSTWDRKNLDRFGNYQFLSNAKALKILKDFKLMGVENYVFVLYIGDELLNKDYYTFEDEHPCPERFLITRRLPVTVMSRRNGKIPKTEVFTEYLEFCEIFKDVTSKYDRDQKALEVLVEKCLEEGIYEDLFKERRDEIIGGFMSIFSQVQETEKLLRRNLNLENVVKTRDKTIDEQKVTIEDRDKTIDEQKVTIEAKNKTIDEQKITIEDQGKTIEAKDKTIDEQKITIKDRDRKIDDLELTVKNVQTKNENLNNEVKTQKQTINELREEIEKLKGHSDGK